ncbi:hypothetical protein BHE74_00036817 [Ensete ventricosum]|nr:hypothetical protein BHE74_00036817 [Ensete ventricosum]
MVSAWRADDSSSGGEALEMKRRHNVWLKGNNDSSKGREEGAKIRAVTVVAACAAGRRRQQHRLWQRWVWEEDGDKGGVAMSSSLEAQGKDSSSRLCGYGKGLEMVASGRGRRGVGAGDNSEVYDKEVRDWEQRATVGVEKQGSRGGRRRLLRSPCITDKGGQRLRDGAVGDRWGSSDRRRAIERRGGTVVVGGSPSLLEQDGAWLSASMDPTRVPPGSVTSLSPAQDSTLRVESVKCLTGIIKSMGVWMDQQLKIGVFSPQSLEKEHSAENLTVLNGEEGTVVEYDLHSDANSELSDAATLEQRRAYKLEFQVIMSMFYAVTDTAILRFMIEVCWAPMMAAFSVTLDQSDDKSATAQSLQGYRYAVHVTSVMHMQTQRDAFVTSVAKFTYLHCAADMKQKNVDAVKVNHLS